MVFQPTAILNPQFPVARAVSIAAACTIMLFISGIPRCLAEGFPGKGNQHDWSSALPYYNLANRYMQKERYQDAIAKYEEAIARYQYDPDFYINLGVAWRKVENFQAAEAAFEKAAELNEKDWMSWSNLANSYLKQDRLEDTIKAFEKALKCNPPPPEKEAMLKDIADIKKILSVRNGGTPPPAGMAAAPAKIISGAKRPGPVNKPSKPGEKPQGLVKQTAREASVPIPKKNDELKDTGWDEVAK